MGANFEDKMNEFKENIKNYCIGCAISKKRRELGLSRDEIALHLHITTQELKLYETGEKEITADILYYLSRLFNVDVSSFFTNLEDF